MLTPVKWAGISQLNNFQYGCGSIKVWRAFHVGVGSRKNAPPKESTQQVTGIKVLKPFRAPDTAKGTLKKPAFRLRNPPSAKDVRERNCDETASALFHVLRKGVLKSNALTTTLSTISTSASTSTHFTGRRSMITSDGSGR